MTHEQGKDFWQELFAHDLYAREGEDPTDAQITSSINRARRMVNRRRMLFDPYVPFTLTQDIARYPLDDTSVFSKVVLRTIGVWLDQRKLQSGQGVMPLTEFRNRYPRWPFASSGTPTVATVAGRELIVHSPPSASWLTACSVSSSSHPVRYRINLKSATGGTYKITVNGQETTGLGPSASMASVLSALESLSNLAPGDVQLTLVDENRHVYDLAYIGTDFDGIAVSVTLTTNTLSGGTGTASCDLQCAAVEAQVIERDFTDVTDDAVEYPEPVYLHEAGVILAVILSATPMINEDEAWRRLDTMAKGAVSQIDEEARASRQQLLAFDSDPVRIRR